MPVRKGNDLCCGQRSGLAASVLSPSVSPLCVCEFPLPGHGEELQVPPGILREGAGREKKLLVLGDSSGSVAVNRFGSLLSSLVVCV